MPMQISLEYQTTSISPHIFMQKTVGETFIKLLTRQGGFIISVCSVDDGLAGNALKQHVAMISLRLFFLDQNFGHFFEWTSNQTF